MTTDHLRDTHGTGYDDDLVHRFTYQPPDEPLLPETYRLVRDMGLLFALLVESTTPSSREASLALTQIEQAVMWTNAGIARRGLAPSAQLGADRLADHVWARIEAARQDVGHHLRGTLDQRVECDAGPDVEPEDRTDGPVAFHEGKVDPAAFAPLVIQLDDEGGVRVRNAEVLGGRGVLVLPAGIDWVDLVQAVTPTPEPPPSDAEPSDPWAEVSATAVVRQARDLGRRVVAAADRFLAGLPGEG